MTGFTRRGFLAGAAALPLARGVHADVLGDAYWTRLPAREQTSDAPAIFGGGKRVAKVRAVADGPVIRPESAGALRYFGYASALMGGIEHETAPFANVATIGLDDPRLRDASWRDNTLPRDLELIVIAHTTFFEPDGRLYGDAVQRWNSAISGIEHVIGGRARAIYLADEPEVTGVSYADLVTAHNIAKASFPLVRTATSFSHTITGAWFPYASSVVPVDITAGHFYGALNPATDPTCLQLFAFLKSKSPGKKIWRILDAFHTQHHADNGITQDMMAQVAWNSYNAAVADPDTEALVGFIWPSVPDGVGARDLPQAVQYAHRQIGCQVTGKPLAPSSLMPEHALFLTGHAGRKLYATTEWEIPPPLPPWNGARQGNGVAVPKSGIFGGFWYFDPSNVEFGLKIIPAIDGSGHETGGHWLYASGYSSLPVTLRVFDGETHQQLYSYHHAGGATPPAKNASF